MKYPKLEALVIGDDHYNTLNVIRSLGEVGIKTSVIVVTQRSKSFVLKSKYVNTGYIVVQPDAETIIRDFSKQGTKIPVLASSDAMAAFLDSNYDLLSKHFILPSVGKKGGLLQQKMDKSIQLKHAGEAGFQLPSSKAINLTEISRLDLSSINFPCIIKPEESIEGSKNDFRICKESSELKQNLTSLATHISRVLVQDFIPNDEVILVAGVRTLDNKNYVFGEINKYKHGKQLNNLGLNCMGVLRQESELRDACIKLVEAIDYHGCYSVEIVRPLEKDTTIGIKLNYFIEINLRTDGLLYFYDMAGINYPAIWVYSCYGIESNITPATKDVYGMNEFLYVKNSFSWEIFKDIFKTDTFSIFRIKDLKPFIYKILYHG